MVEVLEEYRSDSSYESLHFEMQEHRSFVEMVLTPHFWGQSRAKRTIMQNLPVGTVTLLFTDIAGSTHLLTHLGDHYGQVLSECGQILRTAFEEWNGNVVDTQGDAFFAVFA